MASIALTIAKINSLITPGVALGFVIWLMSHHCRIRYPRPRCMVMLAATIPLFLGVALHTDRMGILPFSARFKRAASAAQGQIPLTTVPCCLPFAAIAAIVRPSST